MKRGKTKVASARVFAMQSDILLLDEPTANLDPKWKKIILELMGGLDTAVVTGYQ